uniref:protein BTG3 n=1 Tax=Pristiophorus japonicus TaxID=55135 RepID=UPI00398F350B
MREEVGAGVVFLVSLVKRRSQLEQGKIQEFAQKLTTVLCQKYQGHWYPANPSKGQAYRCIRINKKQQAEPSLLRACRDSDVDYSQLGLPKEITLWIDPSEVCCRTSEGGHPFTVAHFGREAGTADSEGASDGSERSTSDYHSETSSDDEDRGMARASDSVPAKKAETATKMPEYFYQPAGTWPAYPQQLVQYAAFYQPVPLLSYYLLPTKLPKSPRPPPGFLLTHRPPKTAKLRK